MNTAQLVFAHNASVAPQLTECQDFSAKLLLIQIDPSLSSAEKMEQILKMQDDSLQQLMSLIPQKQHRKTMRLISKRDSLSAMLAIAEA